MMKRVSVLNLGVALIGGGLFGAGSALATEFCDIKQTADGFVALRERPEVKGKLVARMKIGDEVMINNVVAAKNGWTRVYGWKGGRFQGQSVKGIEKADGQGWVNSSCSATNAADQAVAAPYDGFSTKRGTCSTVRRFVLVMVPLDNSPNGARDFHTLREFRIFRRGTRRPGHLRLVTSSFRFPSASSINPSQRLNLPGFPRASRRLVAKL